MWGGRWGVERVISGASDEGGSISGCWGWGHGSVSKVLSEQAKDLTLNPNTHVKVGPGGKHLPLRAREVEMGDFLELTGQRI